MTTKLQNRITECYKNGGAVIKVSSRWGNLYNYFIVSDKSNLSTVKDYVKIYDYAKAKYKSTKQTLLATSSEAIKEIEFSINGTDFLEIYDDGKVLPYEYYEDN